MRFCSSTQNRRNRRKTIGASKYKGVSLRRGRWRAYIGVEKKHIELGAFSSEYEAAREYDMAAASMLNSIDNIAGIVLPFYIGTGAAVLILCYGPLGIPRSLQGK